MKKIMTRFFAAIFAFVLLFTGLNLPAFAEYITLDTGMQFTLVKTSSGWTYQSNMGSSTWHNLTIYNTAAAVKTSSGKTVEAGTPVYCLQFSATSPNKAMTVDTTWDRFLSTYYPSLTTAQKTGAKLALIYGHPNFNYSMDVSTSYATSKSDTQALQVATQMILWEYLNGYRTYANGSSMANAKAGLKQDARSLRYWTAVNKWGGNLKTAYLGILKGIAQHSTKPSFNGTTLSLPYDSASGTYTATAFDSNGVLNYGYHWYIVQVSGSALANGTNYTDFLSGRDITVDLTTGGTLTIQLGANNSVTATATSEITGTIQIDFQKYLPDGTATNATNGSKQLSLAIGDPGTSKQQITAIGSPAVDPVYAYLYLQTGSTPGGAKVRKTDASTGDPVAGAQYQLYTDAACTTKAATIDGSNALIITKADADDPSNFVEMKAGTYYAQEIQSPDGYLLNKETYTVKVSDNSTTIIDATDIPIGYAKIKKTEAGNSSKYVAGAVYDIYAEYTEGVEPSEGSSSGSDSDGGDDESREDADYKGTTYAYDAETGDRAVITTTSTGSNTITLTPGTYYVKEVTPPAGYQLDPEVHEIVVETGKVVELSLEDELAAGSGYIVKTSTTDSNTIISGAEYTVYTDQNCTTVAKDISGNDAILITTDKSSNTLEMSPGTYYVQETKSPENFTRNSEVYTLTITAGNTTELRVEDAPKGALSLKKESANTNLTDGNGCYSLEGAVYYVYSDSSLKTKVGELITTSDGSTNTIQVDAGTYYIKEISASPGYGLCDGIYDDGADSNGIHTVQVEAGKTSTANCKEPPLNDPFALQIQKMDADTGNADTQGTASLAGAIFQVDYYDNADGTTTGTPKNTWYFQTNENGKLVCSDEDYLVNNDIFKSNSLYKDTDVGVIYPLGTYTIKEVQPPEYYQLSGTMKFANTSISGSASVTDGLKFVIGEVDDKPQVLYGDRRITAENLSLNAYDEIYKGSVNVVKYDTDGKTPLEGVSFKLVGDDGSEYTGISDSNGNVLFDELIPQHYVLTETKTVDGHSLLKDNVDITIPVQMTEAEAKAQHADTTKAVWDEALGTYCFYDVTYEVSNDVTFSIPMTGGNNLPLYALMVAAFSMMGAGIIFIIRKRKHE